MDEIKSNFEILILTFDFLLFGAIALNLNPISTMIFILSRGWLVLKEILNLEMEKERLGLS